MAARFRAVHVDFGTGDGAFVRSAAAREPDVLVIGVDASVDGLRATSRRALSKPARGGLPNAIFGRLSLRDAPGELVGLADRLTVLLPWGTLLGVVARPDVAGEGGGGLGSLRGLCKGGAAVRIVFGYGPATDAAAIRDLGLPSLGGGDDSRGDADIASRLEGAYLQAGLAVRLRFPSADQIRALPTTWAKRLSYSSHPRRFVELVGRAV